MSLRANIHSHDVNGICCGGGNGFISSSSSSSLNDDADVLDYQAAAGRGVRGEGREPPELPVKRDSVRSIDSDKPMPRSVALVSEAPAPRPADVGLVRKGAAGLMGLVVTTPSQLLGRNYEDDLLDEETNRATVPNTFVTPDKPIKKIERSTTVPPTLLTTQTSFASTGSSTSSTSSSEGPTAAVWNVRDDDLRTLPPRNEFPVERTAVSITDGTPCGVIADRIVKCLKEESIAAVYNDEKATALAETLDHVRFYIRLFRERRGGDSFRENDAEGEEYDNNNRQDVVNGDKYDKGIAMEKDIRDRRPLVLSTQNEESSILVEVQRRSGCAKQFHDACQAVLKAALTNTDEEEERVNNSNLPRTRKPPAKKRRSCCDFPIPKSVHLQSEKSKEDEVDMALDMAACLLREDRVDANLLGVESLERLTDVKFSGPVAALHAARKILTGCAASMSEETNIATDANDSSATVTTVAANGIPDAIATLVQLRRLHSGFATGNDHSHYVNNDDDTDDEVEIDVGRHYGIMHGRALSVLANSFCLLSKAGELKHVVETTSLSSPQRRWTSDKVIGTLVDDIVDAERRPCDAYRAVRCLNALCRCSDVAKIKALERGASKALRKARRVGKRRCALLEREAHELITAFGTNKI